MQPLKVLVDTDGGVDDAAALWYMLTEPAIEVIGIVGTGSSRSVDVVVHAIGNVLTAAGRRDVPLAGGLRAPSLASATLRPGNYFHGEDGLGGFAGIVTEPLNRVEFDDLWKAAGDAGAPFTVLSLCAMSSLAQACEAFPDIVSRARLVAMGGAFRVPGNVTATAESNIARDPAAATAVLLAPWTEPPAFVSLDVTMQALLPASLLDRLGSSNSAAARFLAGPLDYYRRAHTGLNGGEAMPCHDLLAAMSLVHEDLIEFDELPVAIDTGDSVAAGSTIVDDRPFSAKSEATPPFTQARVPRSVDVALFERLAAAMVG